MSQHDQALPAQDTGFNSARVRWAMGYSSMTATLLANGMPVVIGTIGASYGLPNDQLGLLASAFLAGKFLVVCTSLFWIRRVNWRKTTLLGAAASVLLGCLLLLFPSGGVFLVAMLLLGISMACVYLPVLAFWGDVDDPTRATSAGILLQVLGAALFTWLVPVWLAPLWGVSGLVGLFVVALLPIFFYRHLIPEAGRPRPTARTSSLPRGGLMLPLAGLTTMALFYVGLFGVWAFLERIGTDAGLPAASVGMAISASLLFGAGALVVTNLVGERLGLVKPLWVCAAGFVVFAALMQGSVTLWSFAIALIVFNLAWNGGLPYQLAIIARSDRAGRALVLLPAFQAAGAAGGPAVAGMLAAGGDYAALYWLLGGSVLLGAGVYPLLAVLVRRQEQAA